LIGAESGLLSTTRELLLPNCCLGFASLAQHDPVAHGPHSAIQVGASFSIVDPVAVANVE